jgi:hypothetical protein
MCVEPEETTPGPEGKISGIVHFAGLGRHADAPGVFDRTSVQPEVLVMDEWHNEIMQRSCIPRAWSARSAIGWCRWNAALCLVCNTRFV